MKSSSIHTLSVPLSITISRHLLLTLLTLLPAAAFAQPGTINGTVVDSSGASVAQAQVKLTLDGRAADQEALSTPTGDFSFANVPPGPYRLTFNARGFALKAIAGELAADQTLVLPPTALAIDKVTNQLNVTQTQVEIAQEQIEAAQQQRLLGLVPNFFAVYDRDAAPLNTKQKLQLTTKFWLDPSTFVVNGVIAGVGQAQNTNKGFGQGAQGYAKRYGAGFVGFGTGLLIEKVVVTSLAKQDPRYFVKGTGSSSSRAWWAISRTVVCRGDNKKFQFCYSSLASRFGSGFVTQYFFPASARDSSGVMLRGSAIGLGFNALGNLFQEFLAKKITRKKR